MPSQASPASNCYAQETQESDQKLSPTASSRKERRKGAPLRVDAAGCMSKKVGSLPRKEGRGATLSSV